MTIELSPEIARQMKQNCENLLKLVKEAHVKPKPYWCEHMTWFSPTSVWIMYDNQGAVYPRLSWTCCPICKKDRPEGV
jgi:hypothetical protein